MTRELNPLQFHNLFLAFGEEEKLKLSQNLGLIHRDNETSFSTSITKLKGPCEGLQH
jgi:hypothetical protein